jgi:hypothetical protein
MPMNRAILVGVLLAASTALAQPASSSHEAAATAAYEAGDLDTALREFEAAYAETQRADLLYVIGRLHTERKDCNNAISYFQRYLATRPGSTQADAAQSEITKCQTQVPAPADTGGGSTTGGTGTDTGAGTGTGDGGTSTSITTATTATTDTSGSSMDKLGIGLLAGGVVAEGAAVFLYVKARNTQCGDPVCTTLTYEEYVDAEDKAKSLRLTSIIVAGVGAVLVGGGVYRFATHERKSEPSLSFTPTRGGAALSFSGRF